MKKYSNLPFELEPNLFFTGLFFDADASPSKMLQWYLKGRKVNLMQYLKAFFLEVLSMWIYQVRLSLSLWSFRVDKLQPGLSLPEDRYDDVHTDGVTLLVLCSEGI